jgi:hypothetical protein
MFDTTRGRGQTAEDVLQAGTGVFFSSSTSIFSMRAARSFLQCVPKVFSSEKRRLGREADSSPPSSVE